MKHDLAGKTFLTQNQLSFITHMRDAARNRKIKIFEAPLGTAFQHATMEFIRTSPKIKVVYMNCEESSNSRTLFVKLLKDAMNVRFSNLNYFSVNLHNLVLVVRERMMKDLMNQSVLLVFDKVHFLKNNQLSYLLKILQHHKLPCGIILRSTTSHRLNLKDRDTNLHDNFYVFLTSDKLIVEPTTKEEMKIFIKDVHGITNESYTLDLLKNKWGFSKTLEFINRYKRREARMNTLTENTG